MKYLYLWIILGILVLGIIAIIIVILHDRKKKSRERVENFLKGLCKEEIKRENKLKYINNFAYETEKFSALELLSDMLDIVYMLQNLGKVEFDYVDKVFSGICSIYRERYLDKSEYHDVYKDMAIQFDMVARYYVMCKDNCPVVRYNDVGKDEYRKRARALIDDNLIFSEQWIALKEEFTKTFYTY